MFVELKLGSAELDPACRSGKSELLRLAWRAFRMHSRQFGSSAARQLGGSSSQADTKAQTSPQRTHKHKRLPVGGKGQTFFSPAYLGSSFLSDELGLERVHVVAGVSETQQQEHTDRMGDTNTSCAHARK